jgi:septum site-determining protein MinD
VARIISIHSFRGGTGKSNTTANVGALMALSGQRVAVIDADIQSPGIHVLFGLEGESLTSSLNDYLWHGGPIADSVHDVTDRIGDVAGCKLFLIPSSIKPGEIARVLREGYDAQRLTRGLRTLVDELGLDVLLIDTHPGLNEETLLSLVISDTLAIILRPDRQDYEGTGVTVRVARELEIPRLILVVNKAPPRLDPLALSKTVEEAYECPVAAVLAHSDRMMDLASDGIFALEFPDDPLTAQYRAIAAMLTGSPPPRS